LWYPIVQKNGKILAKVFGNPSSQVFYVVKSTIITLGINRFYPADWGAGQRHLEVLKHQLGKQNT
jgi:insertion element IS1 protein InsB